MPATKKKAKAKKTNGKRVVHVKPKHRNVARKYLRDGEPLIKAMTSEGYAHGQSNKGIKRALKDNKALTSAFAMELEAMTKDAAECRRTREELQDLIEMVLARNAIHGEGARRGSTQAATALGNLKKVGSFEQDIRIGVLIHNVPDDWKEKYLITTPSDSGELSSSPDRKRIASGSSDSKHDSDVVDIEGTVSGDPA